MFDTKFLDSVRLNHYDISQQSNKSFKLTSEAPDNSRSNVLTNQKSLVNNSKILKYLVDEDLK